MKVLFKEPFKNVEERDIEDRLETYQELVGGHIETVMLNHGVVMICNEEGKYMGLHPNIAIGRDIVVGNVVFVSSDIHGDFVPLNNIQKAWVLKNF